jgi:hypothetical protein
LKLGFSNLSLRLRVLFYSHPVLKNQVAVDGPKKTRIIDSSEDKNIENIEQDDRPMILSNILYKREIINGRKIDNKLMQAKRQ